jgi:hypothetical protein
VLIAGSSATVIPLQKPPALCGDLANPPQALTPLCLTPNWVVWKWQRDKRGNWTKPPFCPADPTQYAKSDDPATWADRHIAVRAVLGAKADGTGFVQTGTTYAFVDLDKCRDVQTGAIDSWAQEILDKAPNAYREITPSGQGLRVIGTAGGPRTDRKFLIPGSREGARIEVFRSTTHYCTVTGLELGHCSELLNIDALIDEIVAQHGTQGGRSDGNRHSTAGNGADDIDHLIKYGIAEPHRSEAFARVVWSLATKGYTQEQIHELLAAHPNGIAAKYIGRLDQEVVRCFRKWEEAQKPSPATPQHYSPCTINETLAVFERWLILPNKTPVYAVLGTVAANLLPGDPVWLGVIGPPSSAKTEILNSISMLPNVVQAATLTPAGLLSGTSKKQYDKEAKGGLLRQIGDFGIIALKDFGSVLSMRPDAKAEILAALREIYDGAWTRHLGTDGGRTLSWSGKIALLFAATGVIDAHYGVIGAMGDRFLLSRLAPVEKGQFSRALQHMGAGTIRMRKELAEAVARLFAGRRPEPRPISQEEINRIDRIIMLVVRLRGAIERDRYSRDVEAIYGA